MRIRFARVTGIGSRIGLDENRGLALAIFLALIVVIAVIAGFFVYSKFTSPPVGYNTIYLLDQNGKAVDYAHVLVANQNSTFSVNVNVENHNSSPDNYQVQVKIAQSLTTFPINSQAIETIDFGNIKNDGNPVQKTATVTKNTPGDYFVVFELWQQGNNGLTFTQDYAVLSIQVTN